VRSLHNKSDISEESFYSPPTTLCRGVRKSGSSIPFFSAVHRISKNNTLPRCWNRLSVYLQAAESVDFKLASDAVSEETSLPSKFNI